MDGPHLAFIEAYRGDPLTTTVTEDPQTATPQNPAAAYTPRVWHRIDAGQPAARAAIPAPHVPPARKPPAEIGPHTYTVEVATWDTAAVLDAQPALVAANLVSWPPEQQPAKAKPHAETPAAGVAKDTAKTAGARPDIVGAAPASESSDAAQAAEPVAPPRAAGAMAQPKPFKPVWEVDRFIWPSDVERLYAAESTYFAHAGEKLSEAAKEGLRVLVVASAQAGEGCTTLAICLARAAAGAGIKVALIDANLDRPQLSARMGVKFAHSWLEAAAGAASLGETAVASLEQSVTMLPAAVSPAPRRAPLNDSRVSSVIRAVSASVDLVVIDLGPVAAEAAGCFASGANCPVDAAIVVRDVRRVSERETLGAATHLREIGVNAVGIAENYTSREKATRQAA